MVKEKFDNTKIRALRESKLLTQGELAELCNVARQTVVRWEMGHAVPSIETLYVLAEALGSFPSYFFTQAA